MKLMRLWYVKWGGGGQLFWAPWSWPRRRVCALFERAVGFPDRSVEAEEIYP